MIIVGVLVILLVVGGAFVLVKHKRDQRNAAKTAATAAVDHPTADTNLPRQSSNTPSGQTYPTPANGSGPAKPTFSKSSGNSPSHTVPAGVLMNFICNDTPGASCTIILTSTSGAPAINLGAKPVQTDQYGQPAFASWDWTSVRGSWSIAAQASDGSGTTNSDVQELIVQ